MNCNASGIARISDLSCVFGNVVGVSIIFAGIVLFVILLMGGFKYMTSGGDPKAVDAAQKTITYAILGLILILASYLILVLIRAITGVDVTNFKVTI